jgi:hypothetical protein
MNVRRTLPTSWLTVGMLFLNLAAWLDAAWRLAG